MTTKELTNAVDRLTARVGVLEAAVANGNGHGHAPRRGRGEPRWIDAKYGPKPCAVERCATTINKGERCFYEPATDTTPARLYCDSCAKAMGK